MAKKLIVLFLAAVVLLAAAGCSKETKILHCDDCGAEVEVDANSEMNNEDWIIFCEECEEANGLNDMIEE